MNSEARHPYVPGDQEGPAHWYVNNRATIKASAKDTGGAFGLVEMQLGPGHSPPMHIHEAEDESLWLLEGRLLVQCGDQTFTAEPGSFIFTPRGVAHTFKVEGTVLPRLLVLFVPGGGEGFFVDAGRPAVGQGLPTPEAPDLERIQEMMAKYKQIFLGPPLDTVQP